MLAKSIFNTIGSPMKRTFPLQGYGFVNKQKLADFGYAKSPCFHTIIPESPKSHCLDSPPKDSLDHFSDTKRLLQRNRDILFGFVEYQNPWSILKKSRCSSKMVAAHVERVKSLISVMKIPEIMSLPCITAGIRKAAWIGYHIHQI